MKYQTTAAYLSGGICGHLWMPATKGGLPVQADVRREMSRIVGDTPNTFRDFLELVISEHGGDFQDARFTADTVIRVERRAVEAPGKYSIHVWERELSQIRDCADYVDAESCVGDFMAECD